MIRCDVGRSRHEQERFNEISLLPAAVRLIREGHLPKELPVSAPEAADVGSGVQSTLIEADPNYLAECGTLKLDAHLGRVGVIPVHICWRVRRTE
jgi:hypothetical protein